MTFQKRSHPASNYMFKVNNRNTSIFIVNFEHVSHLVLLFLLLTLKIKLPAGHDVKSNVETTFLKRFCASWGLFVGNIFRLYILRVALTEY